MRAIPESLNKTKYWYRTTMLVPADHKGRRTWLHFAGINYSSEIWVNGRQVGATLGAFVRGDFDVTEMVKPGKKAVVAVLVSPQPHPGVPHEHNVANGLGKNGGETAIDGATFLATIGWDWIPAVRDRDTGIFLPVTMDDSGPVRLKDIFVTSDLEKPFDLAKLKIAMKMESHAKTAVKGTLVGTIRGGGAGITFRKQVDVQGNETSPLVLDSASIPELQVRGPKLGWPNGYGPQNLYKLTLRFEEAGKTSDTYTTNFDGFVQHYTTLSRIPAAGIVLNPRLNTVA